ncbi:MAG: ATP-binding cassette domain-containing protein [Candidatus Latescibacteria bacterium]|nr:ATP-binding cassette domain-containing protein [Candidatus Latescibacterota bacterium]
MIEVEHLTKRYGPLTAVNDLSFKVDKGEVVGFLGPNGAGKTTTMRVLTGYLPATEGAARVGGHDIFEEPLEVKRKIGYLPEHPPLYREMRVRSFLDFAAQIRGVPRSERKVRTADVMDRCGIVDRADQLIGQLSKGYQQRVGVAQAIVHNPDVIILDEPTIGLDPNQIREVRQVIKGLGRDHTVILSTHILPEVEMVCDRVIIINKGEISAVDSTDNLRANMQGTQRYFVRVVGDLEDARKAIGEIPEVIETAAADGLGAEDGVGINVDGPADSDIRPKLAAKVVERGLGLLELRRVEMSLEDIFHQLTTSEEVSS